MFLANNTFDNYIIISLVIVAIFLGVWAVSRFFRSEYEYTEDFLEGIAKFRDGILTELVNFIIQQFVEYTPEEGPQVDAHTSGEESSLVMLTFNGDRKISFEIDWTSSAVCLVAQKLHVDINNNTSVIKEEGRFKLKQGSLIDYAAALKILERFKDRVYEQTKIGYEEMLEIVASSDEITQLTPEQAQRMLFSVVEGMSYICSSTQKTKVDRELGLMLSRLFAYVILTNKENFVKYLNEKYEE